jgi:hypothetical protein
MKHTVPARSARRSLVRVFALPLLLFAASIAGLVIGLTGDGGRDIAASSLLFLPLLAAAIAWRRQN